MHWVVYDIPPGSGGLSEGIRDLPGRAGLNDWKRRGYGGPCPPVGRHRYFHKLYALDRELGDLGAGAGKAEVEKATAGHVLGHAELVGTYQKSG